MSLTAAEKVRVAHDLDELGIHLIEAGFPASNPKELELFALLERETLRARATIVAFGMTRRRDVAAAEDPGLRMLAECFAPVCTIVGKTWGLHLEKVVRVSREENLDADRRLGRVPRAGRQARDLRRRALLRRLPRRPGVRAGVPAGRGRRRGAERVVLCDTNGSSLPQQIADGGRARCAPSSPDVAVGIHCHNDLECGVANSLAAVGRGRDAGAGHDERHRRAHRQREPRLDHRRPAAEARPRGPRRRAARAADRDRALRRRAAEPQPRPAPAVGRAQRLRAQGRHARRRASAPTRRPSSTPIPSLVGNRRELLVSELAGAPHRAREGAGRRACRWTTRPRRA